MVSNTLDVIQELLTQLGPIFVENNTDKLTNCLVTLISREGKCQIPVDEEDETEDVTICIAGPRDRC